MFFWFVLTNENIEHAYSTNAAASKGITSSTTKKFKQKKFFYKQKKAHITKYKNWKNYRIPEKKVF